MSVVEQATLDRDRTSAGPFFHQRLTSVEEIAAERDVWENWVEQRYAGNPFLSLDWHLTWLKHFATQPTEIHYIKVLNRDCTAAYFPLILARETFHGIPVRVLRFAGNIYTPMNCPLLAHSASKALFEYVVDKVLAQMSWHLFRGDDLAAECGGADQLRTAFIRAGYTVHERPGSANWVFDWPGITAEDYFRKQLTNNIRNDTKRFPKKLAAEGIVRYRLVSDDLTFNDIDAYQQVYLRSWKEPEMEPAFHPAVMKAAARRGWLRLAFLTLDDRPIAAQLWLVRSSRAYFVKMAYDEGFKRFSPGTLLTWWSIQNLIREDSIEHFDMLKGDFAWKRYWANHMRMRTSFITFRAGLRGTALRVLEQQLLPWVRRHPMLNGAKRLASSWIRN
jgi:CelD/BcsL family acetyltransferase involved in cellulose biosynthesis